MPRIKVEYHKDRCIGQGNCVSISPKYFEMENNKATLKNSLHRENEVFVIEEIDKDSSQLIDAANNCPVNAIGIVDLDKNEAIVSTKVNEDECREVIATYDDKKEWVMDKAGYFLIRIDKKNKNLEAGLCNERNKVILKIIGKKPIDIYETILNKEKVPIRISHAAYLGRELQKAYTALLNDLEYVQDDELNLK